MEKLNPEQANELNQILKLPQEQQQQKIQEFLSGLSEEQLEFLRSQENQTCPFCSIIDGAISSKKIYEDQKILAVLDINPANSGHFIIFPKEHTKSSFEMKPEDFMYLMNLTNLLANKMAILLKADGFNIMIDNGFVAGQKSEHFIVHAIPRFKDDGINLNWKAKPQNNQVDEKIMSSFNNINFNSEKKPSNNNKTEEIYYDEEERIP